MLGTDLSSPSAVWVPPRSAAAEAAQTRLAGTVWQRSELAQLAYRAFYSLGAALGRIGVTANALTYASLVFAATSCIAAARGYFAAAAFALIVGGLCDALDGVVARTTGTVSRYGAVLDSTVDRVSDTLPLLGILVFHAHEPLFAFIPGLALIGAVVIPYARARTEALGAALPSLFMRRPERVVLLVICLLFGGFHTQLGSPALLLLVGTALLAVLNAVGGVMVLRAAERALAGTPSSLPADRTPRRS
jgi:CDP-diacylglycerol--glycerol-3-phosphate 3-phosphatidyltransferase